MYKTQLQKFIEGPERAKWLYFKDIAVFVRKSTRIREKGTYLQCFDVANVNVPINHQKQGVFTRFLETAEEMAENGGFDGIFVESVINRGLWSFLDRKGYEIFQKGECYTPNYYKTVKKYEDLTEY